MPDQQLTLTSQECEVLVGLLESALKKTLVEEHRTRAPAYREQVTQQEDAIKSVLAKLGKTVQ